MFKGFTETAGAFGLLAIFALIQFPGGTILMAIVCNSRRLDGWDWVLSVILPGYALAKVLFSRAC